jgi:hypothetical protein
MNPFINNAVCDYDEEHQRDQAVGFSNHGGAEERDKKDHRNQNSDEARIPIENMQSHMFKRHLIVPSFFMLAVPFLHTSGL